jgi:hypothetical protein
MYFGLYYGAYGAGILSFIFFLLPAAFVMDLSAYKKHASDRYITKYVK